MSEPSEADCAYYMRDLEDPPKEEPSEVELIMRRAESISFQHLRKMKKKQRLSKRTKYGLDMVVAFEKDCASQEGLCAVCGEKKRLCIDHDHSTNKYRGAICISCNAGLGMFRDNIGLLKRAIEYLEGHKSGT